MSKLMALVAACAAIATCSVFIIRMASPCFAPCKPTQNRGFLGSLRPRQSLLTILFASLAGLVFVRFAAIAAVDPTHLHGGPTGATFDPTASAYAYDSPPNILGRRAPTALHIVSPEDVRGHLAATQASLYATRGVAGAKAAVNVASAPRTVEKALTTGEKFVGPGYKEIAPGVFRSADGAKQFRMTAADIVGSHGKVGPHVHFEKFNPLTGEPIKNIHTPLLDP